MRTTAAAESLADVHVRLIDRDLARLIALCRLQRGIATCAHHLRRVDQLLDERLAERPPA